MHNQALSRRGWLALLLPPFVVISIIYIAPVLNLVAISFHEIDSTKNITDVYTLKNYIELINDDFYLNVLWRTLRLSIYTTAICAVIAYPVALYLVRATGWRQTAIFIVLLMPLVTSVTVMSYGWLILLGRNGVLNEIFIWAGVLDAPRQLMYSEVAIVAGLVHVLIVFMVISISASLQGIDGALVRAARSLGASPITAFRTITLPLSFPGLRTGALLVFVLSMSAYATPTLLGGTRYKFLAYLVYQQAISLYNWPKGAAMAVILLIATTLVLVAASVYSRVVAARGNARVQVSSSTVQQQSTAGRA